MSPKHTNRRPVTVPKPDNSYKDVKRRIKNVKRIKKCLKLVGQITVAEIDALLAEKYPKDKSPPSTGSIALSLRTMVNDGEVIKLGKKPVRITSIVTKLTPSMVRKNLTPKRKPGHKHTRKRMDWIYVLKKPYIQRQKTIRRIREYLN